MIYKRRAQQIKQTSKHSNFDFMEILTLKSDKKFKSQTYLNKRLEIIINIFVNTTTESLMFV